MGAYNFDVAAKFPENGVFLATNVVLFGENFPTRRKIFDRLEFRGGDNCSPLPPCHDVTEQKESNGRKTKDRVIY